MTLSVRLAAPLAVLLLVSCDYEVPGQPQPEASLDARVREAIGNWGIVPIGELPPPDTALVRLGQALFFDPILSGNRDVSCGSCHDPARAMADGLSLGVGTGGVGQGLAREPGPGRQFLPRSAASLLNAGLRSYQVFWDGRVSGFGSGPFDTPLGPALPAGLPDIVAAQAMMPVLNRQEMRGNPGDLDRFGSTNELAGIPDDQPAQVWAAVMTRLLNIPAYVQLFTAAFPGTTLLTFRHAAIALAAFETHALTRANTPFDRYLRHDDDALTTEQKRGALLFFSFDGAIGPPARPVGSPPDAAPQRGARCAQCHNGPLLGGQQLANVGVPQLGPGVGAQAPLDLGRGAIINEPFYRFVFRVPPLRNVELTAPYFHNGVYPTLDAVVDHYSNVPQSLTNFDLNNVAANIRSMHHGSNAVIQDQLSTLDHGLRQPLELTRQERADLVAFLRALTDPAARDLSGVRPASVPSGL